MKHRSIVILVLILLVIFISSFLLISCSGKEKVSKTVKPTPEVPSPAKDTESGTNISNSSADSGSGTAKDESDKTTAIPASDEVKLDKIQQLFAKEGFQIPKNELASIDFQLEDLEGNKRSLSSFKGKVVFLNFWATWCPPCRAEIASMEKLYKRLKGKGLEIIGVDLQEDKKLVRDFVNEYKMTYTVLLDTTGRVGQIYGARSIPTSYIIDRNGMIMARTIGGRQWDTEEIHNLFNEILKK